VKYLKEAGKKKLRGSLFQGRLQAQIHEIGNVNYPSQVMDTWAFEKHLNIEAIATISGGVDYTYAVSGAGYYLAVS